MTRQANRSTLDGRVYLDLRNLARKGHRPTDELFQLYALEGFLDRLAASPFSPQLVLKGGFLLAAYSSRRPTRDLDLHARDLSNEVDGVLSMARTIAEISLADGLRYDVDGARASVIRDDAEYSGVRVAFTGSLAAARFTMHIDVNVGDPVWPPPQVVEVPRLLGGSIAVTGYPLTMVLAEKIVTVVHREQANTRWRDFADVCVLIGRHDIAGAEITGAMSRVAAYRSVVLKPIRTLLGGFGPESQPYWAVWRQKQGLTDLPEDFESVLQAVAEFSDPVLDARVVDGTWRAEARKWEL